MNICWKCAHSQAIQDVDEFIPYSEKILRSSWMLCSEWVPPEWESKQLIKTSQYLFRAVLACKRCMICADFSPDSEYMTFLLKEALLWIYDFS